MERPIQIPARSSPSLHGTHIHRCKYLCFTSNTSMKSPERHKLFLSHDILQESVCLADVHAFDGHGCLTCVLEVNAKVCPPSLARLGGILWIRCITGHGLVLALGD